MKRNLLVWAGGSEPAAPVSLPALSEVVYAPPNPDGSRKSCASCFLYVQPTRQCAIHDPGLPVSPDAVCSYHVFGSPGDGLPRVNVEPVRPEHSGLERVPGGTSCDRCSHYSPLGATRGSCAAVRGSDEGEEQAQVEALGCCSRWSP